MRIEVKPLSVNDAWKGRRYRTDDYKQFQKLVAVMLKPKKVPEGKLKLTLVFGFSSTGSDIDNGVKPFLDCLQKKYLFNDNRIYKMDVEKVDVEKGNEFIEFELEPL
jgi:Holliday junction resolvase RusA-like endonuclease